LQIDVIVLVTGDATSVSLMWVVGDSKGSGSMVEDGSGTWQSTVGPFDPSTIPDGQATISISVTAQNANGSDTGTVRATLINCLY
jgi:hypothetical protein